MQRWGRLKSQFVSSHNVSLINKYLMSLTYVCCLQHTYVSNINTVSGQGGSVGKCSLQCQTFAGLIPAHAIISTIFSYFLHISFYCNMQLSQLNIYLHYHLHNLYVKSHYISFICMHIQSER